jgi:hypothetical protein
MQNRYRRYPCREFALLERPARQRDQLIQVASLFKADEYHEKVPYTGAIHKAVRRKFELARSALRTTP